MPRGTNQTGLKREAGPGRPKGSKNKLTAAVVEEELRRIATLDPVTLFERFQGRKTFTLREIHAMPPETRACIASIKVRTENLTAGDQAQDQTVEVRLWDKLKALELCAKHFGWVKETMSLDLSDATLARLDAWKARAKP